MRKQTWQLSGEVILVIGVLIGALGVLSEAARQTAFDGDEGYHIRNARYFGYLFTDHDFSGRNWGDNFFTHDQPMLTAYLLGGWLSVRGYKLDDLPPLDAWDNLDNGRAADRRYYSTLLAEARWPMVGLASGAVVALYLLGRAIGGPLAGLVAATLTVGSPLVQEYLVEARPEAPLMFFLSLALLLGVLGMKRAGSRALPWAWAVAAGLALGLALGTKLTAVFSLVALPVWGALAALLAARAASPGTGLRSAWTAGRGWMLVVVIALSIFVASDPHLYPDPLLHTSHLFSSRAATMQGQQLRHFQQALPNPLARPGYVVGTSLVGATVSGVLGFPLEPILAAVGAATLLVTSWRRWRRTARLPSESFLLLTALAYFGGVSASLLVAFEQYLIPTVILGTLLSGVGAATIVRWLRTGRPGGLARGLIKRKPAGQPQVRAASATPGVVGLAQDSV